MAKIKSQDLKIGMLVRQNGGPIVKLEDVRVFDEAKAPLIIPGQSQAYLPGCVLVMWDGGKSTHSFLIDEELERVWES